ncbi:hypothetical protein PCANC_11296 [Puccinia coronata f. sp. avenae]|uniref:mannan endo-1,4-beta-mannosidase n=1 Tax=Puccinia coronata f. sp. avenae TaxID=200324 RepID=A0A2N5SQ14_9BASI|nr:hypothetical protein PCASD_18128 [Puccinia coronata f. sp. avenae]PLW45208.1 hypothetical protein PCANC_11296 [Puccinia coronata f. sp. avenae]PLW46473.1 hypothetical protein PCASD_06307 [Puccinia coronata f. sp. avenae]
MSLTSGVQILRDRGKSLPVAQTDDEPASITRSSNYGLPDCGSDDSRFVSAPGDGHLYLRGALFDFRAFNTPTLFQRSDFEVGDLLKTIAGFGTPVTRTYTLQVANDKFEWGNIPPSEAHVIGWNRSSNDWKYNETVWKQMDNVLALARKYGVKLIIPIINQDYGANDTDYVGNFNDLIRHRYNITRYEAANKAVDWFTDRRMIQGFKKLISFLLNRVNTINGVRYGDDDTVLAFETGNELNWGDPKKITFQRPPPAKWTLEIARHIKSLAPRTLVMDGSYSRRNRSFWEEDVLDSKYVDLFSYHLYGENDLVSYPALRDEVRAHGKTLIIGEHGFYSSLSTYNTVYKTFDCAGALIWSLRGHSDKSGFDTHSEGNNIYSYHAPGWINQTSKSFDTQESSVIAETYNASYNILGLEPPPKPVPGTPQTFFVTNGTHAGLSWRGATWAERYEIFGGHLQGLSFNVISNEVQDNVDSGEVFVPLDPHEPTKLLIVRPRRPKARESHHGWVDRKWCFPGSACWKARHPHRPLETANNAIANLSDATDNQSDFNVANPFPRSPPKPLYQLLPPMFPSASSTRKRAFEGGWYSVRAINSDGVPGKRSRAVFLKSNWINWHSSQE